MPLQFFLGTPGVVDEAASTYVLAPSASLARVDFAGLVEPTYVLTPDAAAFVLRSASASSTYTMDAADGAVETVSDDASATYVFTPIATSTVIRVVISVGSGDEPTYVFTPTADSGVDHPVAADSTYILAPDAAERHLENGASATTYILTPSASSTVDFGVVVPPAGDVPTYTFLPGAASRVPDPHRQGEPVVYIFDAAASAVVVAIACTPLGRFRRGDTLPVSLSLPFVPDASPYAVVLDDSDAIVQAFPLARTAPGSGTFVADLYLGREYALGEYTVVFTAVAGGVQQEQLDQCFRVVGGGDAGGPVIALASYSRGVQRAVLAHLGSGELVLGRNPSLDLTPQPSLPSGGQYATGHPRLG